jgi:hypothetical protein
LTCCFCCWLLSPLLLLLQVSLSRVFSVMTDLTTQEEYHAGGNAASDEEASCACDTGVQSSCKHVGGPTSTQQAAVQQEQPQQQQQQQQQQRLNVLDWGVAHATLEEVFIKLAKHVGAKAGD